MEKISVDECISLEEFLAMQERVKRNRVAMKQLKDRADESDKFKALYEQEKKVAKMALDAVVTLLLKTAELNQICVRLDEEVEILTDLVNLLSLENRILRKNNVDK